MMFGRGALLRCLLFVLAASFAHSAEKKRWRLEDNVHHSYFNLEGDVTEELPKGTMIRLNGVNYNIEISMFSHGHTFVQLNKEHGAETGDSFIVVADEGDLGLHDKPIPKIPKEDKSVELDDEDEDEPEPPADEDEDDGMPPLEMLNQEPPEEGFEDEDGDKPQMMEEEEDEEEVDFSEDIVFSENVGLDAVRFELKVKQKPGLVFVTQPWCGACKNLKKDISKDEGFKNLMDQFVVVHAPEDAGDEWQADGAEDSYIPRVYFLDKDGEFLDIQGPNKDYKHFIGDAYFVQKGMKKALSGKALKFNAAAGDASHDEL